MKYQIWIEGEVEPQTTPEFLSNPNIHNDNGPAIIIRDDEGRLQTIIYMRHGKLHNADGPAMLRYKNGVPVSARWVVDSVLHNTNGPAIIEYDDSGKATTYEYWILGKHIDRDSVETWAKNINVEPVQMSAVAEHLFVMNFSPELMR